MKTTSKGLPDRMVKLEWRKRRGGVGSTFYYNNRSGALPDQPRKRIALGSDRTAAIRKWAELEGAAQPAAMSTVLHTWQIYEKHARGLLKVAPSTQADYRRCWGELAGAFSSVVWDDVGVMDLNGYLDRRTAKTRGNREMALLSILWNFAQARGFTKATNLVLRVERNPEAPDARYVSDAEVALVKKHAGALVCDAIDLAYLSGQRLGDLIRMRWADVRDGYLNVKQSKTGATVAIAVEGELAQLLERLRARPIVSAWLLTDERGRHPNLRGLRYRFNQAREKAGVQFHLKHMRPKSASDEQAGATERLGHSGTAITKRVYRRLPTKAKPTR